MVGKVRSIAEEASFDLSVLNDVDQSSCDTSCTDDEGTFGVGFFGEKDCEFIGSKWWGGGDVIYAGNCPKTCDRC